MRARGLRRTDDRTQIVGVLDAVAHHDQRRFAALPRHTEDVLQRNVFLRGSLRDHALMVARRAHVVELAPVAGDDRDAVLPRLGCDTPDACALGHKDLIDRPARTQGLQDRVAALDQRAVVLPREMCIRDRINTGMYHSSRYSNRLVTGSAAAAF